MVARSAVSAASGNSEILRMQTFHSRRDWGHAEEYTDAMIRMLELDEPQDLLLASGTTHSLKELISVAYRTAGQPLEWSGEGVDECAHNETGRKLVAIDKEHYNPDPRQNLVGDASLAYKVLNGWETRTPFEDIITEIVEHHLDLNHATSQRYTRS